MLHMHVRGTQDVGSLLNFLPPFPPSTLHIAHSFAPHDRIIGQALFICSCSCGVEARKDGFIHVKGIEGDVGVRGLVRRFGIGMMRVIGGVGVGVGVFVGVGTVVVGGGDFVEAGYEERAEGWEGAEDEDEVAFGVGPDHEIGYEVCLLPVSKRSSCRSQRGIGD